MLWPFALLNCVILSLSLSFLFALLGHSSDLAINGLPLPVDYPSPGLPLMHFILSFPLSPFSSLSSFAYSFSPFGSHPLTLRLRVCVNRFDEHRPWRMALWPTFETNPSTASPCFHLILPLPGPSLIASLLPFSLNAIPA